uniref:Uncharacterized protein n=1 Tax=Cucumis melo TaxID=3656 RepID=A0A9I9EIZ4_CUCME
MGIVGMTIVANSSPYVNFFLNIHMGKDWEFGTVLLSIFLLLGLDEFMPLLNWLLSYLLERVHCVDSENLPTVDQRPSNSPTRRKRKSTGQNEKWSLDESEKGGPKQKERILIAKGCSFSKNRCNELLSSSILISMITYLHALDLIGILHKKAKRLYFNDFGTDGGPAAKYLNPSFLTSPFFFAFSAIEELKLIGNYLKGSRPILTFSSNFDKDVLWKLLKEMIIQKFTSSPNHSMKAKASCIFLSWNIFYGHKSLRSVSLSQGLYRGGVKKRMRVLFKDLGTKLFRVSLVWPKEKIEKRQKINVERRSREKLSCLQVLEQNNRVVQSSFSWVFGIEALNLLEASVELGQTRRIDLEQAKITQGVQIYQGQEEIGQIYKPRIYPKVEEIIVLTPVKAPPTRSTRKSTSVVRRRTMLVGFTPHLKPSEEVLESRLVTHEAIQDLIKLSNAIIVEERKSLELHHMTLRITLCLFMVYGLWSMVYGLWSMVVVEDYGIQGGPRLLLCLCDGNSWHLLDTLITQPLCT